MAEADESFYSTARQIKR